MKKKKNCLHFLFISLVIFGLNNKLEAQTFINPYFGYGVTNLNYPLEPSEIYGGPIPIGTVFMSKDDKLYTPSVYLGFSVIKYLNKYWGIDFQSDLSYQKFSRQDNSFNGRSGAYFWQFRNSIIPKVFIDEKWRLGIGLNIDYMTSNHRRFDQMKDRLDFGGIFQLDYQLSQHFNVHLNYRRTFKVIDINANLTKPLQSLNLGLGYRFHIKK